ncbi:YqaJ viral recombinase family protein [Roseateles sp.]|uniref:YqaJ viral recombinase family protein n=1 Tax=Roseateles sp. TaxID=1971397 RepID=UPI0031D7EDC2
MQKHDLIQGSPEWHAHRLNHFNASDAPAMLGESPYKSRDALLLELHTGLSADVSPETQRIFDEGHRAEALARPLAEQIIGEDLYPVTGTAGKLSASFDGLTMLDDVAFEHKSLNKDLRAVMVEGCTGADLPLHYQIQMEQQCMVSGCERVLFMASKWNGDELAEERHCWYTPNPELAARITAGWAQLEQDLCDYVPPVAEAPKPTGRAPETLPALRIQVTGAVTASNLDSFKETALAVFKGIKRELTTDDDFANAEKTVKWCGDVEERLAAAKQHALSQTESIDALFRTIDDISAEARRVRLDLDKLVKAEKDRRKVELVSVPTKALREHIAALNTRLGRDLMPAIPADFAGAIKGKKSFDNMQEAVNLVLANAKIEANAIADRIQINLGTLRELAADYKSLFHDTATIVLKQPEDLTALVKLRIADQKAEDEARQQRQAEQERIKREAEESAKRARIVGRFEELDARLHYGDRTALEIDNVLMMTRSNVPSEDTFGARLEEAKVLHAQVIEKLTADLAAARDREQKARDEELAARAAAPAPAPIVPVAAPVSQVRRPEPAPAPADEQPTLTLGTINARLGFTVTADFLATLGFTATQVKAARLFRESQFGAICSAIADHALKVAAVKSLEKAA